MRAVILIVLAFVFCAGCRRPADVRMEEFGRNVRQTVDPVELEAWAALVITNTPREKFYKGIPTSGAPKGVREMLKDYGDIEVGIDGRSKDVIVICSRGGGFGHWGFAVGGPGYVCSLGNVQSHWTNGIWFWTE